MRLDLYRSVWRDTEYSEVELLGNTVNSEFNEHDPFIAPDESFLLFCSDRHGVFGENDIFISYRTQEGTWSTPRNLGEGVNTTADDTRPYVTPDGKHLFFNSTVEGNRDIYWVSAEVIVHLKPDEPAGLF